MISTEAVVIYENRRSISNKVMKLSVCISTFKRAGFIGETLESILLQVTSEVEIIVVDGASPDDTSDVLAPYVARYPNLRYFKEAENSPSSSVSGRGSTLNLRMASAFDTVAFALATSSLR